MLMTYKNEKITIVKIFNDTLRSDNEETSVRTVHNGVVHTPLRIMKRRALINSLHVFHIF